MACTSRDATASSQADKENRCCVCGSEGPYSRHGVVPHCYRQHFPLSMKSHLSHDIVLLCPPCNRVRLWLLQTSALAAWLAGWLPAANKGPGSAPKTHCVARHILLRVSAACRCTGLLRGGHGAHGGAGAALRRAAGLDSRIQVRADHFRHHIKKVLNSHVAQGVAGLSTRLLGCLSSGFDRFCCSTPLGPRPSQDAA